MRHGVCLAASIAFSLAVFVRAGDAAACGGCFPPQPPPGEPVSLVTDHRMILSVSQKQTTLYDQIQYSGSPESPQQ